MARRLSATYAQEPVSRLAVLARHIALFSLIATFLSIIVMRFGILEVRAALATFLGALACAILAILVSAAGFISIWNSGYRGLGHISLALLISATILAYPSYLVIKARKLPAIHDITTDPIDPPKFETLARLRTGAGANPAAYAGLYSAEQQRAAYPDIEPVAANVPLEKAYEITLQLITKRKWRIVDARAPSPTRREGHIEAVARTPVMGFRDDVAIRVTAIGEGSRIDIRSASRYFQHDLGANAARVGALIDDLNDRLEGVMPDKKPQAKPSQPGKGSSRR